MMFQSASFFFLRVNARRALLFILKCSVSIELVQHGAEAGRGSWIRDQGVATLQMSCSRGMPCEVSGVGFWGGAVDLLLSSNFRWNPCH